LETSLVTLDVRTLAILEGAREGGVSAELTRRDGRGRLEEIG
jgi:hypothetical protein